VVEDHLRERERHQEGVRRDKRLMGKYLLDSKVVKHLRRSYMVQEDLKICMLIAILLTRSQLMNELSFSVEMSPINLDRIQSWIDQGRLDPTRPITLKELAGSRCLHGIKDGVKLLARGKGELKTPINILVSRASAAAIEAIEAVGGTVTTRYYTKDSIKRLLKGQSENSFTPLSLAPSKTESPILKAAAPASRFMYRLPDPTSRKDLEYYRDSAHRGYLSHLVEKGHGPSLFFKTPGTGTRRKAKKPGVAAAAGENKLW
jgi:large subunit ribosomal protein L15